MEIYPKSVSLPVSSITIMLLGRTSNLSEVPIEMKPNPPTLPTYPPSLHPRHFGQKCFPYDISPCVFVNETMRLFYYLQGGENEKTQNIPNCTRDFEVSNPDSRVVYL